MATPFGFITQYIFLKALSTFLTYGSTVVQEIKSNELFTKGSSTIVPEISGLSSFLL